MSQPGNRRRRRKHGKNKNEGPSSKDDNSRDELFDDFLLMFGESIDPIKIFNVLKKNDWKPEPSVDDLMAMSVSADAIKPPKKFDASMFEDDFEYAARASTSQQSAQNLNSHIFSPAKIRQYDGFHDAKVVYKGDNSEEEADADIIIEEEDVSTDHGLRVLQEFTTPFHKNVFMNASAANMPSSFDHVKQKDNQPKTLNRDFERLNIENNSAFQKNSITQMCASGASNLTEAYPPVKSATTSIKVIYEGCLEIVDTVDRICSLVLNSIKVIVLLRGCPGSGKSYMAEKIISNVNKIRPEIELQLKNHVFSTDDYFMTPRHGYRFDPKMLPSAHTWNQTRAGKALMQSVNPVIIDNTNTQSWEMAPYVQAGVQYGYVVEILEPETKWKFNEYELFRRNIHGVPRVNIKNMLERYEHGITRNNIFLIFQCKYDPSKQPPQIVPDGEKNSRKIGSKVDTVQSNSYSRPANFPQASNLPNSFPSAPQPASHGQEVDNNYQPKNNLATQETNFSKLTASCRTFFEKSLLSSATGTDSAKALPTFSNEKSLLSSATGVDNSKSYSVLSNVAKNGEASVAKTANEKLDRNKAPSRNALLSSMMMKDSNMPDVVAKAPSVPQGWLTFSNPVLPKTGSDGDKDVNSVKSNGNLIDFESRELVENLDTSRESGIVTDLYASRRELLSKEATLLSKLKEAISEQAQLKSAFSSVALTCDPSGSTGLKDSQIIDNDNSLPKTFLNVEPLASPKLESVNVNGEVLNAFNNNSCLMDEALPTSSQNLMPCIDLNKPPSNIQHNAELAQVCDIPSSQSKHSTAVAHDSIQKNTEAAQFSDNVSSQTKDSTDVENESELSPREEENIEKMLSIGDEENHLDSSQSSQDDGSSNKIEGEMKIDSNVGKQPCQMTHSTSNEHDHPGSEMNREDSCLKNDKTPNLDNSSGVTEINEASNVGSDLNTENKQSSNPVSKEKVETPLENSVKTFRFETTKVDKNSSSSKKKDLFFSELKDDPVDDFFDDAEISALLQSLVDLDLEFEDVDPANDSDSDEEKPTSNKGNKTVSKTNDSPDKESSAPRTESTNTNKDPTNTLKLTGTSEQTISDSDSTNIPKPTDNSKQLISNNDSTNICQSTVSSEQTNMNSDSTNIVKPTDSSDPSNSKGDSSNISKPIDSSEQPNLDESLKTCDDSDKCSSISPIAVSPQSKSAAPLSSDESDGLNISTSTKILSDSYYMTVAEDDNISDSVYFDVDSENDKSTNVEPGDSCKRNLDKQRTIEEDEEEKDSSNEPDTSMKIEDEKRRETDSQISFVNDGGSSNKNNDYESFEIIDKKGGEDVVEDTSPQSFEAVEENISNNDEKESDLANQISNITLQEEELEESAKANSSSVEEPAVQKPSNISFDGVKALIKGGVPVKTFDVMSWLKSSLIKESSEEGSGVKNILLEPEEKHSEKNAATNESMMIDESGNVNCKFLEQISKISQEEVDNIATKPAGSVERTVPAVQNCSLIGSNQSNIEGNRRKNKFLNWDSVEDSENSWAEKMKNTLGGSNGIEDDGKVPKPRRENNLLGRLAGLDEKCVNNEQSAAAAATSKVIEEEEPSSCIEPTGEQANTETSNESESFSQKLSALVKIFPESQAVFLGEVLRQCQGDVNWAAGILLEGGCERSAEAYCSKDTAAELVEISRKTSDENQHQASCSKSSLKQKQKKEKKNANNNMCDARLELKKIMEQNFVLSENSYSDHLLKLLKFRRGEIDPEEMMADDEAEAEMDDACDPESTYPDFDPSHPAEQLGATGLPSQPGELDGMDFLDQEPRTAEGIPEDEQMLEFVFNKDVITTLSYNFGSSGFPLDMTGVSCPVKLPMRLARELHSYWMDSVEEFLINENMAMQMMIKEDEELAKRLQQEEASAVNPNLQEVIDYETALMLHEANFKKTREANDSTVAAKLSLSILAEKYPNEKEEFLSQLLSSNNNSLHNTLELLKMTREEQNQSNEQKIADYNKHEFDNCDGSSVFEESETLQSSYERSREEAKMHFFKRNEYFQKAQQEYTSGSKAAASFFSQLANMHMKKMEEANCRSATLLLCTSRSTKNTLDLHFYQVKEAVQVLDLFLDASISRLEESRKPRMKLFIITGRGLHSVNRKSVIRPMVMRRLQQRKIRYQVDDMNPGAIICTLTRCNT